MNCYLPAIPIYVNIKFYLDISEMDSAFDMHTGIREKALRTLSQWLAKKGIWVQFLVLSLKFSRQNFEEKDPNSPKTKPHKTTFPLFPPWKDFLPMFSLIFEQMEIFPPVLA